MTPFPEQPWLAIGAIRFLKHILNKNMRVFEYGAGGSTVFFAKRTKKVLSVEHDREWHSKTLEALKKLKCMNGEPELIEPEPDSNYSGKKADDPDAYISSDGNYCGKYFSTYARSVEKFPAGYFDIILIDGRARPSCFKHAVKKVKAGGYIILDNAEREEYSYVHEYLTNSSWEKKVFLGPTPYTPSVIQTCVWKKVIDDSRWSDLVDKNPYWHNRGHLNKDQAALVRDILDIVRPKNVLEIGFCTGRSASIVLLNSKPEKFISIDIDLDYAGLGGRQMAAKLARDFRNYKVVEGSSQAVLTDAFFTSEFPEGIDLAFVDGGHSYEECLSDLTNVYPYISAKGCALIDDYMSGKPNGCRLPAIDRAVNDFCRQSRIKKMRWHNHGKGCAIFTKDREMHNKLKKII